MRSSSRYRIDHTEHLRQGPYAQWPAPSDWVVRMKSNAGRRRLPYMPTSYFQQIVPTVLSKKRLCQEGTLVSSERCDVPGRNLATHRRPHRRLTSPPRRRRVVPPSKTHNHQVPQSRVPQSTFRSPHSRIAPAPNERRKGVAPDSRTKSRNHSRVPAGPSLLALLWPFFFLPTGGGRLEKVDFGDICDTCVLTGNRAVGELLGEIRKN